VDNTLHLHVRQRPGIAALTSLCQEQFDTGRIEM
jgi:hypothetical protein